jgi:hypothetical protein
LRKRTIAMIIGLLAIIGVYTVNTATAGEPYAKSNVYMSYSPQYPDPQTGNPVSVWRWDDSTQTLVRCSVKECGTIRIADTKVIPRMAAGQVVNVGESAYGYVDASTYLSFTNYDGRAVPKVTTMLRKHTLTIDYVSIGAYNPNFGMPTQSQFDNGTKKLDVNAG